VRTRAVGDGGGGEPIERVVAPIAALVNARRPVFLMKLRVVRLPSPKYALSFGVSAAS
jgi:hypothetical protein